MIRIKLWRAKDFHLRIANPNRQLDFENKLRIFIRILRANTRFLCEFSKSNLNVHYGFRSKQRYNGRDHPHIDALGLGSGPGSKSFLSEENFLIYEKKST